MKKFIIFFLSIFFIFLFYFFNDSYRYSIEAKAYFSIGEYQKAEELAEKAYQLDKYNRMAFTILTQSKIAKQWKQYIQTSKEYFFNIESISNKEKITNADKIRVKMMLELIIGEYKFLKHSKLLDKKLEEEAEKQYKKGKELYNGIFKKRDG